MSDRKKNPFLLFIRKICEIAMREEMNFSNFLRFFLSYQMTKSWLLLISHSLKQRQRKFPFLSKVEGQR